LKRLVIDKREKAFKECEILEPDILINLERLGDKVAQIRVTLSDRGCLRTRLDKL
jgi:hypothetical protein